MPPTNPRAKEGSGPEKSEVNAASAGRQRLLLIARRDPVGRTHAPIRRTLRRPGEPRIANKMHERPLRIIGMVGGDPQLAARPQGAGNFAECPRLDEATLVVAEFRPGIRKEDKHHRKTGIGQSLEDVTRIIGMHTHIRQPLGPDLRQELGNPVLERLAANEAGLRMQPRLRGKMFAPAETNLESKS